MARPTTASPLRGFSSSPVRPSPERRPVSDYLSPDRNSEARHQEALDHARLEHERIRLNALRIGEIHHLQEEQKRIEEAQKKEQERLKAEAAVRAEQERLRELQAKKVEPLPPQPEPPKKQTPPPAPAPEPKPKSEEPEKQTNGTTPAPATAKAPATASPFGGQNTAQTKSPFGASPFAAAKPAAATSPTSNTLSTPSASSPFAQKPSPAAQQTNGASPSPFAQAASPAAPKLSPAPVAQSAPAAPAATAAATEAAQAPPDRYVQIHQELKKLRKKLDQQSKVPGSPLKGKLGDMRRSVRKAIGQLTAGAGANKQPIASIATTLRESLSGTVPSDMVDASLFVKDKREPIEGAVHNGEALPSIFIFLLSHLAKAIVRQFATEAGVDPKAAEPIGIVAAHIFSNPDFHWRGKSMIDVLIAKYRVACPVLFGARGSDKTEAGRVAIGWRKEDGHWITEQAHMDRMNGLGAGYASISLRDFSKAGKAKQNPYPPTNYWKAVAAIVNTPPQSISSTHFTVLKAMIDGHESRFIQFYGNAALAALRMALVEFPKKAPPNSHGAQALQVMGQVLQKNGLVLA